MPKRVKLADVALVAFRHRLSTDGFLPARHGRRIAVHCRGIGRPWPAPGVGRRRRRLLAPALLIGAGAVASLALLDSRLAARAYPIVLSLAAASAFAITLWQPQSLVEKLALASGEVWSSELQSYCRNVTAIWALWLAINAAIAAGLALSGDDAAWALWTGAIFYLVSGALFAVEWLVRRSSSASRGNDRRAAREPPARRRRRKPCRVARRPRHRSRSLSCRRRRRDRHALPRFRAVAAWWFATTPIGRWLACSPWRMPVPRRCFRQTPCRRRCQRYRALSITFSPTVRYRPAASGWSRRPGLPRRLPP